MWLIYFPFYSNVPLFMFLKSMGFQISAFRLYKLMILMLLAQKGYRQITIHFGPVCIVAAHSTTFKKSSNQVIQNLMVIYTNLYVASTLWIHFWSFGEEASLPACLPFFLPCFSRELVSLSARLAGFLLAAPAVSFTSYTGLLNVCFCPDFVLFGNPVCRCWESSQWNA